MHARGSRRRRRGVPRLDDPRGAAGRGDRRPRLSARTAAGQPHELAAAVTARASARSWHGLKVLTVIGNRPQFIKAAAVSPRLRAARTRRCWSTPASTSTTSSRRCSSPSSACRPPTVELGDRARLEHLADGAHAGGARAGRSPASDPDVRARLRRHELDAGRRACRRAGRDLRSRTSRRACGRSTARCPRSSTACSPTTRARCCCARRELAVDNLRREARRRRGRAGRRRDGRRRARRSSRRRASATDLVDGARRRARASTCSPPPTGRATSTTPRGSQRSSSCCSRSRCRSCCRSTRARTRACARPGLLERARAAPTVIVTPPLGYSSSTALLCNAARGPDRLGRAAEGGLPRRRAVRHAAAEHRVDRDGRRRLERARRPRRDAALAALDRAAARRAARRCTATATPGERVVGRSYTALRMMSDARRSRIGVAGLGYWGPNLARNFAALPGCELAGAATPRRPRGSEPRRSSRAPGVTATSTTCSPIRRSTRSRSRRRSRARRAGGPRARGRQALLRREAAGPVGRRRRARGRRRRAERPDADGRPPARVPPGRPEAQGAGRRGRARRPDLLHLRQPAEPRQAARRRERPVEPRRPRRLGRAAPRRRGADRGRRPRASPTCAQGVEDVVFCFLRFPSGLSRAPAPVAGSTRTRSGASRSSARGGWRPSTTWRSRAS